MRSLPDNPFDGHTLAETLEQVEILTEQKPKVVFVDKGYRGAEVPGVKVWRSAGYGAVSRAASHRTSNGAAPSSR